jgi:pimeloyl-ACP methyl ester carboxylesterase
VTPHTHTRTFGHGSRQALAIHCTLAHSGAWRGVGEALANELSLLAYDMPSHGKSGDWDRRGNVHDVTTDMGRALLTEPMDVIGHSFGATVALRLAVESPAFVRSLTLIEPVYYAPVIVDEPERVAAYDCANAPFVAAMESGDMEAAARAFHGGWGNGTSWEDVPKTLRDYMVARIHFVAASTPFIRDDSAGLLAPGLLTGLNLPVLLIQGTASPDISDAVNAALARQLPDATRVRIAGAGHMVPLTHPQQVADTIRAFLPAD